MSNNYDISLIRKYLNGELDAREMYQLERRAQEDPLLMDLIRGMESGEQKEHEKALYEIDQLISQRANVRKATRVIPLIRWSVAASVVLLSGIAAYFMLKDAPVAEQPAIAVKNNPSQETELIPEIKMPDSVGPIVRDQELAKLRVRKPKILETDKEAEEVPLTVRGKEFVAPEEEQKARDSLIVAGEQAALAKTIATREAETAGVQARQLSAHNALQGRVAGVVVTKRKENSGEPFVVSGIVKDKTDRQPLPGVVVKVKGMNYSVTTDINGRFSIPVFEAGATLELAYIGFNPASVKVKGKDSLNVVMEPSALALNEVVVGYGTKAENENTGERDVPAPLNGWVEYNKYLREQAVVEKGQTGTVVLAFSVSSAGVLSDFTIIKSSNPLLNAKAIDLVKSGPGWKSPSRASEKVRLRIKFREKE